MSDTESQSTAAGASTATASDANLSAGLSWLSRVREAFGFKTSASLRQNLEAALSQEDALDAAFSAEERRLIRNILRLRETRVADVMVPRADIAAVEVSVSLVDLLRAFEDSGHSRMPVYRETLDDAIGMVHIKDLVGHITGHGPSASPDDLAPDRPIDLGRADLTVTLEASRLVRTLLFVPPSMPATDLLQKMQATHIQMALVIDEYGGTDGLVSIEDIVETIVGEIGDEHDDEDGPMIRPCRMACSSPTPALTLTRCGRCWATASASATTTRTSIRWAACCSPFSAACRCGAKWSPPRICRAGKSRWSTPTRAASRRCAWWPPVTSRFPSRRGRDQVRRPLL